MPSNTIRSWMRRRSNLTRDFIETSARAGGDPMEAARRGMRPVLPKRFYKKVSAEEKDGGFALLLDGKTARTPARKPLTLPSRALARAIAAEWDGQESDIDPAKMPLTRLANLAIDRIGQE